VAVVEQRAGSGPTGLVSIAGLVAVLVATLSFGPIVQGLDWWSAAIVFSAAAVGATSLGRALGMRPIASGIFGLAPLPLLAIALDGDGHGLLGLLPTQAAVEAVDRSLLEAGYQIYQESVPATSSPGVVLLIATGAAVAAVLVDVVAVGFAAPLGAVPVVVALAIVPGKALRTSTDGWLLAGVAIALLLLIAADRRRRSASPRTLGLVSTGAAGLVVALLGSFVLPAPVPSQADALPVQPLFGPGADPLIRLGDNLRRGARQDELTYTTTSTTPVYLRLAVLERFSGATWYPNEADAAPVVAGEAAPRAPGVPATGRTATTEIVPANTGVVGARLPLPYPATEVRGVSGFNWDTQGLTAVRERERSSIDRYSVDSRVAQPSKADLQSASASGPPRDATSKTLPETVPSIITRTTRSWTRGAPTEYAKALAIQNQLRAGAFLYDENTPAREGYDGDGLAVIARFLQVKSGYCVHFAATMAVMARVLGIPSRVVVGYQPGKKAVIDGRTEFQVVSTDLHAWPELYFAGQGWVRFEPTPGRGAVPAYAPVPAAGAGGTGTPKPTPTAGAATTGPDAAAGPQTEAEKAAKRSADVWRVVGTVAATAGGLLVLLALPGLARILGRRRRLARLRAGGTAEIGWREVVDTGADLGMPPPDGSPRVMAAALERRLGAPDARAALGRIRDAFEVQTFGRRSPSVSADDVRTVLDRLRSGAGRAARFRGTVAPVSLLGRLRRPRLALRWTPPGSGRPSRAARLGRLRIPHRNRSRP
jgi:transglutaminase-like putative cysteine protease